MLLQGSCNKEVAKVYYSCVYLFAIKTGGSSSINPSIYLSIYLGMNCGATAGILQQGSCQGVLLMCLIFVCYKNRRQLIYQSIHPSIYLSISVYLYLGLNCGATAGFLQQTFSQGALLMFSLFICHKNRRQLIWNPSWRKRKPARSTNDSKPTSWSWTLHITNTTPAPSTPRSVKIRLRTRPSPTI